MRLYLFGGYNTSTEKDHWNLILQCIKEIAPKQILYIGFAENRISLDEKYLRFQNRFLSLPAIDILDSNYQKNLDIADSPLIFVGGGNDHDALLNKINDNKSLKDLIFKAEYYFGDSAGSMVTASRQRSLGVASPLMEGLEILKDTIIEPHYTQRNRHQLLKKEMKSESIKIGIGIDEVAGVKIELENYPNNWVKLGSNQLEVLHLADL